MKLLETWVKHPALRGAEILILSECLATIWPGLAQEFSRGRTVLTICPEAELSAHVTGKLASMIRSSAPRTLTVLSVAGSPHCSLLHALVNEALYLAQAYALPVRHFVVVEGNPYPVSSEAIRVSRYLNLVEELVRAHPEAVEKVERLSLEQQAERRAKSANPGRSC